MSIPASPLRWIRRFLPVVLLAFGTLQATAGEGIRLSGFGTLGYAWDNRGDIAPSRDISQKPRDGFATGPGWRTDSRLGIQLEYNVAPSLDLIGQFIVRDQFHSDHDSLTQLAYAAFRPDPQLDIRAGRLNYDAFLMSDHRNVGYAYLWVRPPTEFYGWIPVFSVDGADVAYTLHGETARWRLQVQAANARLAVPIGQGYDFRADRLLGVSLTRHTSFWRLKAAYSRFTIGSEVAAFTPLFAGLDAMAASAVANARTEAADLRRELSFQGARITYATLGAAYDDGSWLAQAEFGRTTSTADVVPHGSMAYASIGRRFGNWTPYLMIGVSRPGNDRRSATADWGSFNATLRDPALFTVNTTRIEQETLSVGTRWNFHPQAALKLQWDHTRIHPSGYGLWWRSMAIQEQKSRINLLSATLDFAF